MQREDDTPTPIAAPGSPGLARAGAVWRVPIAPEL